MAFTVLLFGFFYAPRVKRWKAPPQTIFLFVGRFQVKKGGWTFLPRPFFFQKTQQLRVTICIKWKISWLFLFLFFNLTSWKWNLLKNYRIRMTSFFLSSIARCNTLLKPFFSLCLWHLSSLSNESAQVSDLFVCPYILKWRIMIFLPLIPCHAFSTKAYELSQNP